MAARRGGDPRIAFGLLAAGALVCIASVAWAPRATAIDGWEPFNEPVPRMVSARGPAIARYDAANDTTVAAFLCGHWHCQDALRIEGDARANIASGRVALAAVSREEGTAPLEPPLTLGEPFQDVTRVTNARFVVRPFWPAFATAPVGALLLAAGVLALRAPSEAARAPAAAAVGAAIGASMASFPGDAIVWGFLYVVAACALALIVMSVKAWKKGRWAAAAFALATVAMFVWARPWFPGMPSL